MNRPMMKVPEVCWELNISRPTLIKRIKGGIIECTKDGRDYRFNPDHIQELKEGTKWQQETDSLNVRGRPIGSCEPKLMDTTEKNLVAQLKERKLKKSVQNG